MVVRIRLSRFGCNNKPFYRVMAADSRSPRDGKHLEVLGYYNPLPGQDGGKRMGLNFERVKYWLSVGAQPSEPVQRILFRAGLLPPPPMMVMGRKGGPRDTRTSRSNDWTFFESQRSHLFPLNQMLVKMTLKLRQQLHEACTFAASRGPWEFYEGEIVFFLWVLVASSI
ncbi:30S RIBOSOMAL PROTEIN S16-LIKE [Salix purpurea]|uniref:30S RIBOSOMAL PROTEIN S16-LIKE n=1 Tax=Salix purpurea TaxID=77065 RepID=A0A9Q0WDW8_SALPP|nr:30S RIBOSOMAL PROTEIN S16-LIKE [Salix purpurea]